jgi:hypothetical protein
MKNLGTFRGFPTYRVSFKELDDNCCMRDVIFVNDFGDMFLNGEVIGKLDFKTYAVEEYAVPYPYKTMAERAKEMLKPDPAPVPVEVKLPVDEVVLDSVLENAMKNMVVCGIDLEKIVKEGLQVDCSPI